MLSIIYSIMASNELVTLYSIYDHAATPISYVRSKFYDEQIEIAQSNKLYQYGVWIINIFLVNRAWEIIIQKRSSHKRHNPNLLDKSIWWHIQRWDPVDYTVMVETVEELQVPSIVIREDDNFEKRYGLLQDYLNTVALVKHIDTKMVQLKKIINKEVVPLYNMTHIFFGVYGWSVKNVDREAKWILYYDIDELVEEMKSTPGLFTDDLHTYVALYGKELREFINFVRE